MNSELSDPVWTGWHSWNDIVATSDPLLSEALKRPGAYSIAVDPPKIVDPTEREVVYIGETHRRTLRQRLLEFGRSAGFGGTRAGHSGGLRWTELDPCPTHQQFRVALCPVPTIWEHDARGDAFPSAVEGNALLSYAVRHGRLPSLVEKEATGASARFPPPAADSARVQTLLRGPENEDAKVTARAYLSEMSAIWGEKQKDLIWTNHAETGWKWQGYERKWSEGWLVGLGWSRQVDGGEWNLDLWCWKPKKHGFWHIANNERSFRQGMRAFSNWWNWGYR